MSAQYRATATVERPIAAEVPEEPTLAASVIHTKERTKTLETVDEVMLEVPGTRVQRFGGLGSFTALSLRGAEFDHTTVLFGNIPLRSADGGAFDLSTIPMEVLERAEVYRGAAPAWIAQSGIGGVVQLSPREANDSTAEAGLSAGSFGLFAAHAATSGGTPSGIRWTAVSGVTHSDNDFSYRDERGTHFDTSDDIIARRRNAEVLQAHTLMHVTAPLWDGELEAMALGFERTGGEAGPAFQGSELTHRTLSRYVSSLRYSRTGGDSMQGQPAWRWQVMGSGAYSRNRLSDRLGEIGLGQRVTDDRSFLTQLRSAGERQLLPWLGLTAVSHWEHEHFAPYDALSARSSENSDRDRIAAAVEPVAHGRLGAHRWQLRPLARMELISSRLSSFRPEALEADSSEVRVVPTFRLGAALELTPGVSLAASALSAVRIPTMVELFGDRGYLEGDTRLRPERAVSADVGVSAQGRMGALTLRSAIRGFLSSMRDLIVFSRINAQGLYGPRNTDEALIYGVETSCELAWQTQYSLTASVTAMRARDSGTDRELPLRPRLQAYLRPEYRILNLGFINMATLFADVQYRSSFFSDVINTVVLPEQWVFGMGVRMRMLDDQLELASTVRNLFDAELRDVVAFPLPGRNIVIDVTWHAAL